MNGQIKEQIKIPTNQCSIKVAFQANIFKYIQKRKQEASIFAITNKKFTSFQKNNQINSSNLIQRSKDKKHLQDTFDDIKQLKIESTKKMALTQRKFNPPLANKKRQNKGYKSCLSDWRNLYDQREEITDRNKLFSLQKQKMIATDRLFYPAKKQNFSSCQFNKIGQDKQPNKPGLQQITQNNLGNKTFRSKMFNTISNFGQKIRSNQFFNDENFFHLYHRSKSPTLIDFGERKRIINFLNDPKHKVRVNSGLRLMNEGILNDPAVNDVAFVPYKQQQSMKQSISAINPENQLSNQLSNYTNSVINQMKKQVTNQIKQKETLNLNENNRNRFQIKTNRKTINIDIGNAKNVNQKFQNEGVNIHNPQTSKNSPKIMENKVTNNLSEILSDSLISKDYEMSPKKQLELKLFKPRKNKIQRGIFNAKKLDIEQKSFANFSYSLPRAGIKNT